MTPDEMLALTEQARRIKRFLDGESPADIYGMSYKPELKGMIYEDQGEFLRNCITLLTGPDRLDWAKVVNEGRDLYELGEVRQAAWRRGDKRDQIRFENEREEIETKLTALANLLAAGMEGSE